MFEIRRRKCPIWPSEGRPNPMTLWNNAPRRGRPVTICITGRNAAKPRHTRERFILYFFLIFCFFCFFLFFIKFFLETWIFKNILWKYRKTRKTRKHRIMRLRRGRLDTICVTGRNKIKIICARKNKKNL